MQSLCNIFVQTEDGFQFSVRFYACNIFLACNIDHRLVGRLQIIKKIRKKNPKKNN
jgi:hypothetical protein